MLQYGRLSRSQASTRQKAWLNVARSPLTRFARVIPVGRVVAIVALCFASGCYGSLRPQQSRAGSIVQTRQQPLTETARAAAAIPHRRTGYPLLASYNGFALATDVPAYAYYNLVIASQDASVGTPSPLALLRLANPTLIALLYQRTLQVDYPLIQQYYGTNALYPGWWLLRAGSVLKTKINADTDMATLKTDVQSITKSERVYMLVVPQTAILSAADRINTVATMLSGIQAKLASRLAALPAGGSNPTLNSDLSDMQAQINNALTEAQSATSDVANLQADNGVQSTLAANNVALKNARAQIVNAQKDLKAAQKDARDILQGLKSASGADLAPINAATSTPTGE